MVRTTTIIMIVSFSISSFVCCLAFMMVLVSLTEDLSGPAIRFKYDKYWGTKEWSNSK